MRSSTTTAVRELAPVTFGPAAMSSHPTPAPNRPSALGSEPLIAAIARGLASTCPPWEPAATSTPPERRYELLLETGCYDAWLIHWPAGTGLDAHDHGGSSGAFAVVDGTLDEDTVVQGVGRTRSISEGEVVWFDEDHVHAVVNRGERGATSVHVYSPPLRAMSFYRSDDEGCVIAERVSDLGEARR